VRAYGQTAVWGTHIGVCRVRQRAGWLQQLWEWWVSYTASRRHAQLAALDSCWDARREALKLPRAAAAPEMAAAQGVSSMATPLYSLTL
jgi:hypothetical protein